MKDSHSVGAEMVVNICRIDAPSNDSMQTSNPRERNLNDFISTSTVTMNESEKSFGAPPSAVAISASPNLDIEELRLRGQTGKILRRISLEDLANSEGSHEKLAEIAIDMTHARGKYQTAASLIEQELSLIPESIHFESDALIQSRIRLLHHKMFFLPVEPIWLEMQRLKDAIDPIAFPARYGEALFMLGGNLGTLRGEYDLCFGYLMEAIAIAERLNDKYLASRSLRKLADLERFQERYDDAIATWERAWEYAGRSARTNRQGIYLSCCRGDFERQKGEFGNARTWLESALEAAKDAYIPGWIGNAYLGLAELALDEGRLKDANDLLDRARPILNPLQICGECCISVLEPRGFCKSKGNPSGLRLQRLHVLRHCRLAINVMQRSLIRLLAQLLVSNALCFCRTKQYHCSCTTTDLVLLQIVGFSLSDATDTVENIFKNIGYPAFL